MTEKFRKEILKVVKQYGLISIRKAKEIALKLQFDDYVKILKEMKEDGNIKQHKIVICPGCFNDLGSVKSFTIDLILCIYCNHEFTLTKKNKDLFFHNPPQFI
jgi:hypothetical protein